MGSFVLYRKMEKVPARMKQLGEIRILVGDSYLPTLSRASLKLRLKMAFDASVLQKLLILFNCPSSENFNNHVWSGCHISLETHNLLMFNNLSESNTVVYIGGARHFPDFGS